MSQGPGNWEASKTPGFTILEHSCPPVDEVLKADIDFHLGDFERYQFNFEEILSDHTATPEGTFCSFNIARRKFLVGEPYEQGYEFVNRRLRPKTPETHVKVKRAVETLNFLFDDLAANVTYACDFQDARRTNYAAFFGTERSLPVMQHHRLRGTDAVIVQLAGYTRFPCWNMPPIEDKLRFSEKKSMAVWRGALSGEVETKYWRRGVHTIFGNPGLNDQERIALLQTVSRYVVCKNHKNDPRVNAKIVIPDINSLFPDKLPILEDIVGERISIAQQLDCKYLLALDGYDWPSNIYWSLNSNSVVLRQASEWEMHGECFFQPWVHYVPLAADCGDLTDKLDWCENNLAECERIIANARAAWKVLFNISYQQRRQTQLLKTLTEWTTRGR